MSSIIVMSKPYRNKDALENIISYALNISKNELIINNSDIEWEGFGVNCFTPQNVVDSFNMVKRVYSKTDGKQLCHFVLSIYKKSIHTREHKEKLCSLISYSIGNYLFEQGYQCVSAIHSNSYENVHVHFIMNTVNGFTGMKLQNEKSFYDNLLYYLRENYNNLNWESIYFK